MITLKNQAKEKSTYIIEIKFKDEDGKLSPPNEMYWWLQENDGSIVNDRDGVEVDNVDKITDIVLSGDDLTYGWKIFSIEGTYDSTYGTNLPFRDAIKFYVNDVIRE